MSEVIQPPSAAEIRDAESEHFHSELLGIGLIIATGIMAGFTFGGYSENMKNMIIGVDLCLALMDIYAIGAYFQSKLKLDDLNRRSREYILSIHK